MSVFSYNEFCVLKAIFMFEVYYIFHFMEFSAHFLAELELISFIEDGGIVFQKFRYEFQELNFLIDMEMEFLEF